MDVDNSIFAYHMAMDYNRESKCSLLSLSSGTHFIKQNQCLSQNLRKKSNYFQHAILRAICVKFCNEHISNEAAMLKMLDQIFSSHSGLNLDLVL